MLQATEAIHAAPTLDDVWRALIGYADVLDADLVSYHHHAPDFAGDAERVTLRTHGFPEDWIRHYRSKRQHLTDPITQVFATRIRPMRWSEVDRIVKLTPAQADYLASLRGWLKGDGLGLPAFGPGGRHGYVGIGRSTRSIDDWCKVTRHLLHWVVECFHLRWCELVLTNLPRDFTLTAREQAILNGLSLGMDDEVMCGLVGASLDSVQRSIRQVLRKMGVTDRPSAVLRGIGAGLLDPGTIVTGTDAKSP